MTILIESFLIAAVRAKKVLSNLEYDESGIYNEIHNTNYMA